MSRLLAAALVAILVTAPAAGARERRSPRLRAPDIAALIEPSASGYVNAVQIYPYTEGVVYRLYAAPERLTDIALQAGETLNSVAAGDTARWTIGDTTSGSGEAKRTHILIKPFAPNLQTNLFVATDRRTYQIALESRVSGAMPGIAWSYPADEMMALKRRQAASEAAQPVERGLAVELLNFNYAISGDAPDWRPLRAFDDGRQTFIEFPASIAVGEAPPLFVIGAGGDAELVNYRMRGRYYVVDRLFAAAELRLGAKRQAIVRIARLDAKTTRKGGRS